MDKLITPERSHLRQEILSKTPPIPEISDVYGWFLRMVLHSCLLRDASGILIKDSIETAAKLTESHTLLVEVLRRMEAKLERLK